MATRIKPTAKDLYDEDFFVWSQEQAALLRERRFDELDLPNLIEEVEDLGGALQRSVRSRARTIGGSRSRAVGSRAAPRGGPCPWSSDRKVLLGFVRADACRQRVGTRFQRRASPPAIRPAWRRHLFLVQRRGTCDGGARGNLNRSLTDCD
jgi:hypothetical protein